MFVTGISLRKIHVRYKYVNPLVAASEMRAKTWTDFYRTDSKLYTNANSRLLWFHSAALTGYPRDRLMILGLFRKKAANPGLARGIAQLCDAIRFGRKTRKVTHRVAYCNANDNINTFIQFRF